MLLFCLIALLLCNTDLASSIWMNIDKTIGTALTSFSVKFFLTVTKAWKKCIIGNDGKVFCYQNSIRDVASQSTWDLEWTAHVCGKVPECTLMSWQLYSYDDNLICGTSRKALCLLVN